MAAAETSISNPPPKHTSEGWFYNKRTCREVSPGLDAPRVAGSFPNSSWSEERYVQYRTPEPTSMFGFYTIHRAIHIVVLCDIFVDVFDQHFLGQKIARLLILLYIRPLITFIAFFLCFFFSLSRLVNEKNPVKSLKFRFIG